MGDRRPRQQAAPGGQLPRELCHISPASSVAMPRKLKKPMTSVTVLRMFEDDCAGSCPSTVSTIGIAAPAMPAMIIESTIDTAMIKARP